MKIKTPAKLNIGLDIVGKRADGYHLLDTVMQTIDLYDELEFETRDDGKVVLECDSDHVPEGEESLVVKAVRALTEKGMTIRLKCHIPSRAGMGAGSSDAAATLKAVNEIYKLGKSDEELETIGTGLGADIPFFIKGGRQRAMGIGEKLTKLNPVKEYYVVIKPEVEAVTKDIYKRYDEWEKKTANAVAKYELDGLECTNVLEHVTAVEFPIISEIKKKLLDSGAVAASMTGSGTAVYGIFEDIDKAKSCIENIGGGRLCQAC